MAKNIMHSIEKNDFLRGVTRTLTPCPSLNSFFNIEMYKKSPKNPYITDREKIADDWKKVGKDIEYAIKKYENGIGKSVNVK